MKKTRLYCDRCDVEGKETPAVTPVWIKVGGVPRSKREDVCADHLQQITGGPAIASNGASAPQGAAKPEKPIPGFGRNGVYTARYAKVLPYLDKHPVLTLDDLTRLLGLKSAEGNLVRPVMERLMQEKRVERVQQGIYVRAGYTIPKLETAEAIVAAAAPIIKAQPGIRSSYVAARIGASNVARWREARDLLRSKGYKFKGSKSAMRMFPPS